MVSPRNDGVQGAQSGRPKRGADAKPNEIGANDFRRCGPNGCGLRRCGSRGCGSRRCGMRRMCGRVRSAQFEKATLRHSGAAQRIGMGDREKRVLLDPELRASSQPPCFVLDTLHLSSLGLSIHLGSVRRPDADRGKLNLRHSPLQRARNTTAIFVGE